MDEKSLYHICECQFKLYEAPIRVFRGGEVVRKFDNYSLGVYESGREDAARRTLEANRGKPVFFNIQGALLLEGAVYDRNSDLMIYVGLARAVRVTEQILRRHLSNMGVHDLTDEVILQFLEYINRIPIIAPGLFAVILSSLNTFLNGDVIEPREIFKSNRTEELDAAVSQKMLTQREARYFGGQDNLNSIDIENRFLFCVRNGMVPEVRKLCDDAAGFDMCGDRSNPDAWRMLKDRCVVGIAIVSRTAISAGLPSMEGVQLRDLYIQRTELCTTGRGLTEVRYQMLLDFTERVHELNMKKTENQTVRRAAGYIMDHLEENISLTDLAAYLNVNKNHLCSMFKEETGMGITEYTQYHKINMAKQLLRFTDKPLIEIANYLSFCSQSYFQQVFKKVTGVTPTAYRNSGALGEA